MAIAKRSSGTTRKVAAISAGLLVIGVGVTYTLASWTDSEWVWGGADGDPGVGTSSFNIEQDTTSPFANTGWVDEKSNPGGELQFTTGALALTPGDTIYAPVALRTDASSVAGEVTLKGAVAADGIPFLDDGDLLWNAIELTVYAQDETSKISPFTPTETCDERIAEATGWPKIVNAGSLGTSATGSKPLAKESGDVQHYCFALTLPQGAEAALNSGETLQGRTIAPAWEFAAVSQ